MIKNEIKLLFWEIHGILKLRLSKEVLGIIHKSNHPTPSRMRGNTYTYLRGFFVFLNRDILDQIKSLLYKPHAGCYELFSHGAVSFPFFF